MEPTETKKKMSATAVQIKLYPRKHLLLAAGLAVSLTVALGLFPSEPASAKRSQHTLALDLELDTLTPSETASSLSATHTAVIADTNVAIEPEAAAPAPLIHKPELQAEALQPSWQDFKIKNGDSLALIFKRAGLPSSAMYELLQSEPKSKELTKIHPGKTLSFAISPDNSLQGLRYKEDQLNSISYMRTEKGFKQKIETRTPDSHIAFRSATISTSLFDAGQDAGMPANLIMEFANIFGWDVDFALDIRKGDSFNLLFEEQFLDGEKIGSGNILAAEFINQGETFKAVRYTNTDGDSHYFTPDGKSMRKAFLRAPLDFNRISSNFNPKRLHPVYKVVRPHRGTDYAASKGTPVYASGNGRVITSAYNKASGNYVVIQHTNNIQTKYLHLSKRTVKKGQKVRQKQLIGKVGSTGYSTAPHLHYEFLLNGVHRNPRTILAKLPKAESVPNAELANFKAQTQSHLAQLGTFKQGTALALANNF